MTMNSYFVLDRPLSRDIKGGIKASHKTDFDNRNVYLAKFAVAKSQFTRAQKASRYLGRALR